MHHSVHVYVHFSFRNEVVDFVLLQWRWVYVVKCIIFIFMHAHSCILVYLIRFRKCQASILRKWHFIFCKDAARGVRLTYFHKCVLISINAFFYILYIPKSPFHTLSMLIICLFIVACTCHLAVVQWLYSANVLYILKGILDIDIFTDHWKKRSVYDQEIQQSHHRLNHD